jgi:nitrite reductase/ring-hydroxylating ferredoxin subunit
VTGFVTVARADELAPGEVRRVKAREDEVALARVGDESYALQNACLHLEGPLGEGRLEDQVLTCPWHGGSTTFAPGRTSSTSPSNCEPTR